jgi:hypothetical protein
VEEDRGYSTQYFILFQKSKKSKSKSVFSEELSWANLSLLYSQKIWKLSLLRRKSTSKACTLDAVRATRQFKGGWCKVDRPSQTGLKNRSATRKVGPKMSARKREVLAWCESVISTTSDRKIYTRAADLLMHHQIRDLCSDVSSVAGLAATIISFNIIDSWESPPTQGVIDCWIPKQASQNGPAAFNTLRSWLNSDSSLKSFVIGNATHRWSQLCPTRASTQLSYDQSLFTCKELNKRLNCAAEFGLAPEKVTTLKCKKELTQLQESMSLPKLGSNNAKQRANLAKAQRRARDTHWQLVRNACASDDHKE